MTQSLDKLCAHIAEVMQWFPMDMAPKDGTEILVLIDSATVPIVRTARYQHPDNDENWTVLGLDDDDIGWWSYRHSVTQEKLTGYDLPRAWMPMPDTSRFMR